MIKKRWGNRLAAKSKRHTSINKVRRSAAMAAIENFAEEEEESSEEEVAPPPPAASRPVASTKTVDRNNLFNQIVTVSGQIDEAGKPSLFYVLVWHVQEGTCDLVRVKQDGCFSVRSSRLGKPRYKLVPEGQGEEMTRIPVSSIRVVHSEAVYKLSDADKEAWNLLEEPRLPSPPPEPLGDAGAPAIPGEPVHAGTES